MSDQATNSILSATRLAHSGQVVVLPKDDLAAFTAFTAELVACLYPANGLENQWPAFVDNLTGNLQIDQPQEPAPPPRAGAAVKGGLPPQTLSAEGHPSTPKSKAST